MLESTKITVKSHETFPARSLGSVCLDFFLSCETLCDTDEKSLINKFNLAFIEDPDMALRTVFYLRDSEEGLGKRIPFGIIMRHLANSRPKTVIRNLHLFPVYGGYDDMLCLLGTRCEKALASYIKRQLDSDLTAAKEGGIISVISKKLPVLNSGKKDRVEQARRLCKLMNMGEGEYSETLTSLRRILGPEIGSPVTNNSFYHFINTLHPLFKRKTAFSRDENNALNRQFKKVMSCYKTDTLGFYPYDIIHAAMTRPDEHSLFHKKAEKRALDAEWRSLPDFSVRRNAIAVINGSDNMFYQKEGFPSPISIAVSLGIYLSERCTGRFKDHFIPFSKKPRLVKIKGKDIIEKTDFCTAYNEGAQVSLCEVFRTVLQTAIQEELPAPELPETVYIISNTEFEQSVSCNRTLFDDMRALYGIHGYKLPSVVYWNVSAENEKYPIIKNEQGVTLVSGSDPLVFGEMLSQNIKPRSIMEIVLGNERYRRIKA